MRRAGHLLEQIAEPGNLRLAFWKAARCKWGKAEVQRFATDLDQEIESLQEGLLNGDYPVGRFHRFTVHDPKKRIIHAAAFPERVLHHAIMNVCEPVFERLLIHDSYACRRGKGQWAAVEQAQQFVRAGVYFLKLDVRKYFDSIAHRELKAMLARRFRDRRLLEWFDRLIDSYETTSGRGLPIGSLTSQHMANFYLGPLDRLVKETLRRRWYVRYMDDMVIWGTTTAELRIVRDEVARFLGEELDLTLKDSPSINRTQHGMDFLGCRVFPGYAVLNGRSRRRFRRRLMSYTARFEAGAWDEATLQRHTMALLGFARQTRSWRFRRGVLEDLGQRPIGLEPREPWRQLEQQRPELPVSEPQQEQPGEPEQQPGVPRGPSSDRGRMASRN